MKIRVMCDGEELVVVSGYLGIAICSMQDGMGYILNFDGKKYSFLSLEFNIDDGSQFDGIMEVCEDGNFRM